MVKIKALNNVPNLMEGLSQIGIGKFRDWKWLELEWSASTDYFDFGEPSKLHGESWLKDNLALYLQSDSGKYVERILLCMNQRNKEHKQESYAFFMETFDKIFQVLELNVPDGINAATITQNNFHFKNDRYSIETKIIPDPRTDYYKLTVSAK